MKVNPQELPYSTGPLQCMPTMYLSDLTYTASAFDDDDVNTFRSLLFSAADFALKVTSETTTQKRAVCAQNAN